MICLVSPPTRANSYMLPFALLHLSAWLNKEGLPSRIIDMKSKIFNRVVSKADRAKLMVEIVNEIKSSNPEYVGITCFTYDYNTVVELAKLIKNELNTKIIVGGIHPTCVPNDFFFEGSPFDFIVVGDGELPLTDLLSGKKSLEEIPGLGYKETNGNIRINDNTSTADYMLLPQLPYEQLDMEFYATPNTKVVRYLYASGVNLMTAKGCPFSCTFCANKSHKILYRPIKTVVDEIELLHKKYKIDSFYIQDDTFGIKKERVIAFLDELESRKLNLFWGMETRVNLVEEPLIKRLANAHCIQIDFGVESGSQESLDRMKKGIKVENTIKAFDLCRKYGIRSFANIMFNTPGETADDVNKTIELLARIRPSVLGLALTLPLPGTQIYKEYVNPKIEKSEYYLYENERMYGKIMDNRFKMATHNIDLSALLRRLDNKYMFFKKILDCTTNLYYYKTLIRSKRKSQYLYEIIFGLIRLVSLYSFKKLKIAKKA